MDYIYTRMLSKELTNSKDIIAQLQEKNTYLLQKNRDLQRLLPVVDKIYMGVHEEKNALKAQAESLKNSLSEMTSLEGELRELKFNCSEAENEMFQLEQEIKQLKKENQDMSSNAKNLRDEIGKLNRTNQSNQDLIYWLKAHLEVVEEELLEQEHMAQEKDDILKKEDGKNEELTKILRELSITMQDLRADQRILQEKLDDADGENAVLRQLNCSSTIMPHNILMNELEKSEKAAQEETKSCMTSQMLNAEDSQQAKDETSYQEESKNLFEPKKLWSGVFFKSKLATMVAVLLLIAVLLSSYITSKPSCNIESGVQNCTESLEGFLEQIPWFYWGMYHLELPPL